MASIVYVSSSTTDVITEIASTSEVIISNLQGPQGATGPQGPQGTPGGIASVVAPITNAGTETAAIIGINSSSADTANYVVQRDANGEFVAGAVTIDTTKTPTSAPGKLYWDGGGTVNLGLAGGNVSVALGENLVSYVTNAEATTLAVGEVVYVFGAAGDRPSVKRASNASEVTSSKTLGIVGESIAANGIGFVFTRGIIGKLALGSYTAGAPVYLGSTPGTFTSTKPVAPANLVALGWVIRANNGNGEIYLNVQNGFELEELHNVSITSAANGNFLVYDSADSLWKNQAISATAPVTYNASTRTIAANAASTSASGVVQLSDSTSTTSSVLAATPTAVKAAYDLATTANATANAAIPATQKAAANGVATLDASGLVPTNQLPALAITNTFVVNSQAAMLALTAETGDVAIRTDLNKSFILTATPASTLANWQELLTPPDAVTSVDGRVGAVTLTDLYAAKTHASTHASGGTDAVTLAQSQITNLTTDLAAKAPLASPTFTGTVTIPAGSSISGVAYLATANTFTQPQTANSFIPTSSTVPANGINLPNTNTLGLVSNSVVRAVINASGLFGVATTSPAASFHLVSSTNPAVFVDQYGNDATGANLVGRKSRGSVASPTAVLNGDFIVALIARGYGTTAFGSNNVGLAGFQAAEDFTDSAQGVHFVIGTTPTGSGGRVERFRILSSGSVSINSTSGTLGSGAVAQQFGVVAGAATTVGAVIRGAASQSANLTEWQTSAGTVASFVRSDGVIFATSGLQGSAWLSAGSFIANAQLISNVSSASNVGVLVRGAAAQSADLTQWQTSAGVATTVINSAGRIYTNQRISIGFPVATPVVTAHSNFSNDTDAARIVALFRGASGQTANLAEFHDSNSNVLSSVSPTGTFVGNVQDSQLIQYGAEGSVLQNIPTRVHPAETLLKQAVWWIDSAHSGSSGQAIKNLGWGGAALDATAGSTTAADSNDPQYLAWDGRNYVYGTGVTANFLSTPDATALDIVGDIDLRIQVAMDDWTPAANTVLLSKFLVAGNQRSFRWLLLSTGFLRLAISTDGSAETNIDSSVVTGITDGTPKWVRVTLDVDNGASGKTAQFFTSDDGITWTQLGTTVTSAGTTSIFSSTAQVEIGSNDGGFLPIAGKIYRAQILNGIDGVPVLDVDTSVIATGAATSFTALTGQTVTINRSTSGRKTTVVTHPVWLFGTDDFMEVNNRWLERTTANYLYLPGVSGNYASTPDSAALDITGDIDLRCKVALDDWTPGTEASLISKWGGSYLYYLSITTFGNIRLQWFDSSSNAFSKTTTTPLTLTDGSVKWIRATLDVDNGASGNDVKFFTSDDGTTWTQWGSTVTTAGTTNILAGNANLGIGAVETGTGNLARGKFFRAQVLNGIGGTVAFDANFETGITTNLPTTFTESSANAATVTINYSGTGYRSAGVIASTYVFPGNPNTFKLSSYSMLDFGATESFTVLFIMRNWPAYNYDYNYLKGITGAAPSWSQYNVNSSTQAVEFKSGAVTISRNGASRTDGSTSVTGFVLDRTAETVAAITNGALSATSSTSTLGSVASPTGTLKLAYNGISSYTNLEFVSAAIFRRALTASEIATLNSYFQGRVA